MNPNTVVLEISSDEDVDWNGHDGRGFADGGDDHNWLEKLLDEVNKENCGDDSDEVVLVSEVSSLKKSKYKSSLVDSDDECVVLDHDPDKPVEVRNDNPSNGDDDSDDILLVSEKGQVACRDYPHPRHLCIKFPFSATPNQNHCEQCYCYVCDSLAPCVYWGNGSASTDHCHATDKDEFWTLERKNAKNGSKRLALHRPTPAIGQSHNQIPTPGSIYARHTSANFRPPNIISQNRSPIFASRSKFHPDLVSQFLLRTNGARGRQSYNHRPVFKRTGSVGVATTVNRHPSGSYRGNLGNPGRQQQNYQCVGSIQPNSVDTSVSYPLQSQNFASFDQSLPPQSQFSNRSSPSFQSNPFPENLLYQSHPVPTSSGLFQPSYMVPAQPSYPVPSQTQIDNQSIPVSGHTLNIPEGNQVQNPTIDPGLKDYESIWPTSEQSATLEGAGLTNELSVAAVPGSLADYRYDWIFEDQPVEPGLIEVPVPYGSSEFSSDSSFIDTGPIFDF